MRKDVVFESKGLTYRGWLYMPDNIDANHEGAHDCYGTWIQCSTLPDNEDGRPIL